MREAIGGQWILGIVLLFIVLFSGFLAYSINYTRAFKAKDHIIELIEKNEGFTFSNKPNLTTSDTSVEAKAYFLLDSMGYNSLVVKCGKYGYEQPGGYCVQRKVCSGTKTGARIYYEVTTFIKIDFPVINYTLKLPITGETNTLFYESDVAAKKWADKTVNGC
ncbi:MAG: hypothetical protein GX758_04605 [Tenericutes bacterium]|nr:hypothetical protein [Mycoplasmatota bacterium]